MDINDYLEPFPDNKSLMTSDGYASFREELGLTQRELSHFLGCTIETISRREQGRTSISFEAALALRYVQLRVLKIDSLLSSPPVSSCTR